MKPLSLHTFTVIVVLFGTEVCTERVITMSVFLFLLPQDSDAKQTQVLL